MERGGALVSAAYAARRIGVTARTVRRWVAAGVLAGRRVESYRGDRRCRWFVERASLEVFTGPTSPRA